MLKDKIQDWVIAYQQYAIQGIDLVWPSETLIRLFRGAYVPDLDHNYAGKKVVDIGFGNGNNLFLYAALGMQISGVEIHADICQSTGEKLDKLGKSADLRVGNNKNIPFDDNEFDFLVSWNVLHYESNEADILKALSEYQRVLKPGGRFFLSTTGPEHKILQDGQTLGGHRYQIGRKDDFRKGNIYYYFDAPNYVTYYFSQFFSDVMVGRTHDFLLTETLDWFIVTGVKA